MDIEIETHDKVDVVDITTEIDAQIPDEIASGICHVFVRHTTAGVIVNENEQRLITDIVNVLQYLVSDDRQYKHNQIDNNATAHLRSLLLGESVTVPINEGTLDLGTWQSILFVEGDGPRSRQITITSIST
ncbi:MAG: secondary thiamine-phosphate synthase enzyme YjbQ [Halobacteriaceae archaeon]